MTTHLPIITDIPDIDKFIELLKTNPGLLIIKFGAEWCGPCKQIEKDIKATFSHMPATIQTAIIDIDINPKLYAFLKSKKMVNGIPVILCYKKGNLNYVPDDIVVGADRKQISMFFERCITYIK